MNWCWIPEGDRRGTLLVEKVEIPPERVEIFHRFYHRPWSFLLETGMAVAGLGCHSFIGSDPFLVFISKNRANRLVYNGEVVVSPGHPLTLLKRLLARCRVSVVRSGIPFHGGAVGYFSYDLGRQLERLPSLAEDDLRTPDCCLGFYDTVVAVDHERGEVFIVSCGFPETGRRAEARARQRVEEVKRILFEPAPPVSVVGSPGKEGMKNMVRGHFNKDTYCRIVERAREYILAGDIFEVNLSQRFSVPRVEDPWSIYRRLRSFNPAPFAAYLNFGRFKVISASPERFLKVEGKKVETRPIKGTRPRGRDPVEDELLRRELWFSEKDRAELVMIVDLERNDLGRVCRIGSVKVPELFRLEEYATVFHLVSTVEGELLPDKDVVDLLVAAFPGGSITGAPKVRAMEIIEELEPVRRGIYTGSIGYIGFDGNADLNIVIRTILAVDDNLYFQAGGAVTADSDPEQEYFLKLWPRRGLWQGRWAWRQVTMSGPVRLRKWFSHRGRGGVG